MQQRGFFAGISVGIGIILGAWFVSRSMDNHTYYSRSISVKGLSERDIVADEGIWTLHLSLAGDDIAALNQKAEQQKAMISSLLVKEGFEQTEINVNTPIEVTDRELDRYREFKPEKQSRYLLDTSVVISTRNVQKLFTSTGILNQLLKQGLYFKGATQPVFFYTKLNEIKPDMLKEAGANAHKAALELANNTNSKVGKIKTATQGVFSIRLRGESSDFDSGFAKSSPYLRARVVTNVAYFITD